MYYFLQIERSYYKREQWIFISVFTSNRVGSSTQMLCGFCVPSTQYILYVLRVFHILVQHKYTKKKKNFLIYTFK